VISELRTEFPDITVSKIRYLEAEGLIEPARTGSGYRKFSVRDVDRLRYVLACQRDRYLPLRVIRAQLEAMDRGGLPPNGSESAAAAPVVAGPESAADAPPAPLGWPPVIADVELDRNELQRAAGLDDGLLEQLESFGLLSRTPTGRYDGICLEVAKTVAEMARYGFGPRHLRGVKTAAAREAGLIEQAAAPLARQRGEEARARAEQVVADLARLLVRLHAGLLQQELRSE
jgi:DNA-binding transcriptional MerR regulator